MPPSRKPLQIDAGRIFRWSFLLTFLVFEWVVWQHILQRPVRRPRHRMLILLLAPWATRRATLAALILAGVFTMAGMLFVRLVVAPLLNLWLSPAFDPSSWMFHLSAGEAPEASVPARFRSEGSWRPGALVLTGRRIWFLPAAWGPEPWSMARKEFVRVEAEPPAFARFLPVRHWPDRLRFTDRAGDHASFAVADPDAVLAWFAPSRHGDVAPPRPRVVPEGVFDA
jgi:hypothetical protein